MEEKKNAAPGGAGGQLHLLLLLRILARSLWMAVLAGIIFGCLGYIVADLRYKPQYQTRATFVVHQRGSYSTVYGNLSAASGMANSFSQILQSDVMRKRVAQDIGVSQINGTIEATTIPDTNLLELRITADKTFEEAAFEDSDMLFIPGGKAGVENFLAHAGLAEALRQQAARGRYIAAVCAGPSVPGSLGLLAGRNVTCFPGWESHLAGAHATGEGVVADGPFLTGRGLGFSVDLALRMIEALEGEAAALDIKKRIQHPETV